MPSERTPKEMPLKSGNESYGRIDVFVEVDTTKKDSSNPPVCPRGTNRFLCLIEMKVGSGLHSAQELKYPEFIAKESASDKLDNDATTRGVCIYIAPGADDSRTAPHIFKDEAAWYALSFQTLHDEVLLPCLDHEDFDADMRPVIDHYVRALRSPVKGEKMAITDEERELAKAIYTKFESTLKLLTECLESSSEPEAEVGRNLAAAMPGGKQLLELPMSDGSTIRGKSVGKFFLAVLNYADAAGKIEKLAMPVRLGRVSYLLNSEPKHGSGTGFHNFAKYEARDGRDVFVDTNWSRGDAVPMMSKFLRDLGLTPVANPTTVPVQGGDN